MSTKQYAVNSMNLAESFPVSTRLYGGTLWAARLLWVALFGLMVSMFFVNAPTNFLYTRLEWPVQVTRPLFPPNGYAFHNFITYLIVLRWGAIALFFAVSLLIAWRRSDDWLALFVSASLPMLAFALVFRGESNRWLFPAPITDLRLDFWLLWLIITCLILLLFIFPSGRITPRWLGIFAVLAVGISFLNLYLDIFGRYWVFETDWRRWVYDFEYGWVIWGLTLLSASAAGIGGQIYQYRRLASPLQRQQAKWGLLGVAGIFVPVLWMIVFPIDNSPWSALIQIHLQLLSLAFLPLAIGVAILRYRLWDIDLVLNRALVYAGLTAALLLLYGLVLGGLAILFQTQISIGMAVLATGIVAVAAHPHQNRLQRAVDRLMYGNRRDPAALLSHVGKTLDETDSPAGLLPAVAASLKSALKLPFVQIEIDQEEREKGAVAQAGRPTDAVLTLPLVHLGQEIGRLTFGQRRPDEPFSAGERRLLAALARQIGAAVYATRLAVDLQRSREALVVAREEERRRLRRDLHDGLGPRLATITLKVDTARNLLAVDPPAADERLRELKGDIQEMLREIRQLVYDLRPPALDQLGLLPALRQFAADLAEDPLHIEILPAELPLLPAAVEVAAYRIAMEALANTARHSRAAGCRLKIEAVEGMLQIEIADNGRGFEPAANINGVGLASMRERAAELGGSCHIAAAPGQGTRILVRLPLGVSDENRDVDRD